MKVFIEQETGRLKLQSAISEFTERCFPRCLNSPASVQKDALTSGDQTCLANCVGRYLDVNIQSMITKRCLIWLTIVIKNLNALAGQ
jgi:hypothetical protein